MESHNRREFSRALALACVTASGVAAQYAPVQSPASLMRNQFDWYVDKNSGNDSTGNGKTPATAYATIGKLLQQTITAGQTIGFAAGSYWKETFLNPIASLTVKAYGQYAAPQPISSGSWTSVGGGTPNVYSTALPFACVTWGGSGRYIAMAEDAGRLCDKSGKQLGPIQLIPMATLALCNGQQGSYYVNGTTLYVHAYDDSNPTTNGYKYTWRNPPMLDGAEQLATSGWTLCNGLSKTYFRNIANVGNTGSARECNAWEAGNRMGYCSRAFLSTTMTTGTATITTSNLGWSIGDLLFIGSEQLLITSDPGGTGTFNVSRAQNGTTAAAHTINDYVVNATKTEALPNTAALAGGFTVSATCSFVIHASDDSSPNSSGKIYEYTARDATYDTYGTSNCSVYGIATQKCYTNDGSMRLGRYGYAKDCLMLHGGKHMGYGRTGLKTYACACMEYYYGGQSTIGFVYNEDYPTFEGVTMDYFQIRSSNVWPVQFTDTGIDGHGNSGSVASSSTLTVAASGSKTFTLVQTGLGYPVGQVITALGGSAVSGTTTLPVTLPIATGSRTFTVTAGLPFYSAGIRVRATGQSGAYMEGAITSYSGTSLVVNVDTAIGSGVGNNGTESIWAIITGSMTGAVTAYSGTTLTMSVSSAVLVGATISTWSLSTSFGVIACSYSYIEHAGGAFGQTITNLNYCATQGCNGDAGDSNILGGIFRPGAAGVSVSITSPGTYTIDGLTIISNTGGSQGLVQSSSLVLGVTVNVKNCDFQNNYGSGNFVSMYQPGPYSTWNIGGVGNGNKFTSPNGRYTVSATGVVLNSDYNHYLSGNLANGWQWWDGAAVQTYSTLAAYSLASGQDTHSSFV